MELTTPINLKIAEKLKTRSYFHKFFIARAGDEIAERIRYLRKFRKLNQAEFAARAGMKQSAVSRIEQAEYAGWNFKTLARVAEALDVRLQIIFTPMEEVIKEFETAQIVVQTHGAAKSAIASTSEQRRPQEIPSPSILEQIRDETSPYRQESSGVAMSTVSRPRTGVAARANQQYSGPL